MLLKALGYLALAAAFFLPWTVGELIKSAKAHEKQKQIRWGVLCGACVLLIAFVILLAFALKGAML